MITEARKNILVVEDDPAIADLTSKALVKLGYSVVGVVDTGEAAILKADQCHPHLVIMDIVLNGPLDGIQAGREIEKRFSIPTIYITGYRDKALKLWDEGKVSLLKPFQINELEAVIGTVFYLKAFHETHLEHDTRAGMLYARGNPQAFERTPKMTGVTKSLLIAEDHRGSAEAMELTLKLLHYKVLGVVRTAKDAIEQARKLKPDLVLMDIMLEGESNGIEAGQTIQKEMNIPVLYITAYREKAALLEKEGLVPLLKPFDAADLSAAVGVLFYKNELKNRPS